RHQQLSAIQRRNALVDLVDLLATRNDDASDSEQVSSRLRCARVQVFLIGLLRPLRVRVPVTFYSETPHPRGDHKGDDTFLCRREDESVSQLLPLPPFQHFQRGSCFARGRTRSDG